MNYTNFMTELFKKVKRLIPWRTKADIQEQDFCIKQKMRNYATACEYADFSIKVESFIEGE